MQDSTRNSYEEVPYHGNPLYPTHPDCLATLGTLLGMTPAPPAKCRVLELGCGTGGNLLPMALVLPESRFLGVDLSPRQIEMGQATARAAGLTNLDLQARSILDITEADGKFDYIICHGVYSWVPPPVQEHILDICQRNLAPNGIAYVSYNAYPGWHNRGLVREMLGYHAKQFSDPEIRVNQARAFLKFLVEHADQTEPTYRALLKDEADLLAEKKDWYIYHEHLEDYNEPLYFSQFMRRAQAHGLQYLSEAWGHARVEGQPPEVQATLREISRDLIQLEQYLDFLRNRTFRRTLLCHASLTLDRAPTPERVSQLKVSGLARPVNPEPVLDDTSTLEFRNDEGVTASTNIPVVKTALLILWEVWPRVLTFEELWSTIVARLATEKRPNPPAEQQGRLILAQHLVDCYLSHLVGLHVYEPPALLTVPERPLASPLAREQARTSNRVASLRHRTIALTDFDQMVLPLLDGRHDREAILAALTNLHDAGTLAMEQDGKPITDPEVIRQTLDAGLTKSLQDLARGSLLMA